MKVANLDGRWQLKAEDAQETAFLNNPETRARVSLRFPPVDACGEWRFRFGDSFAVDEAGREAILPCHMGDDGPCRYWVRVMLDFLAVKYGLLPLHCAVVRRRDMVSFILAPSSGGKSLIAWALARFSRGTSVICDDHCQVGREEVAGNSYGRLRGLHGDFFFSTVGSATYSPKNAILLVVEEGAEKCVRIPPAQAETPKIAGAALKYLLEKPRSHPVDLEERLCVMEKYRDEFRRFVSSLGGCYLLTGTPRAIAKFADKLL